MSAATQQLSLKLGADGTGEEDLEDVFVTNLDSDLPPSPDKKQSREEGQEIFLSKSTAAEDINAEWRRLQMKAGGGGSASAAAADSAEEQPISVQPSKFSEADVFLQPSQLEEMLGQNSLMLDLPGNTEKHDTVVYPPKPQHAIIRSKTSPSAGQQASAAAAAAPRRASLWDGFMSCLNPVVGMLKKEKKRPPGAKDNWEIPFADIRELDFIGSGSQGAVFVGEYLREKVAVKKVKDVSYCQEAKHLRKLSHPNIVKFVYVLGSNG